MLALGCSPPLPLVLLLGNVTRGLELEGVTTAELDGVKISELEAKPANELEKAGKSRLEASPGSDEMEKTGVPLQQSSPVTLTQC